MAIRKSTYPCRFGTGAKTRLGEENHVNMTIGFTSPGLGQNGTTSTHVRYSMSPVGSVAPSNGWSRPAWPRCSSGRLAHRQEGTRYPRGSKSVRGRKISDENTCENKKLDAAADYFQCLIGASQKANARDKDPSERLIAQCDAGFQRAVERAEAGGACHTPGNPSVLGDPIKARAQATALGVTAELGGCTALNITNQFATCTLGVGGRGVDLAAVIDAINNVGGGVDNNTPFYIETWGGDGGAGNTNNGSRGGFGGYAQTTATTGAVAATYGTTELYYFLGDNGSGAANAGGDGGTATMVTTNDLATE